MEYEQMEIDFTLDEERPLKYNIEQAVEFRLRQYMNNKKPVPVMNHHEGYGIVAERFQALAKASKTISTDFQNMGKLLSNGDGQMIDDCGTMFNSAVELACCAIDLGAQAKRVLHDLYSEAEPTPVEQQIEQVEEDGFSEAEPAEETEDEEEEETDEAIDQEEED